MSKIISFINHKGGVGKTNSTHNLGKAFALAGKKVLLIDNDHDPQANLTTACGVKNLDTLENTIYTTLTNDTPFRPITIGTNLDLIPSELSYARTEQALLTSPSGYFKIKLALEPIQDKYDYILIDCPPSLGVLTSNALTASDYVIIMAQSSYLSIKGLQTIIDIIEELKKTINQNIKVLGFILTQLNNFVVRKEMDEMLREAYPGKVFDSAIRLNVAIEEATTQNLDIFSYSPESAGAKDYKALAKEIIQKIEDIKLWQRKHSRRTLHQTFLMSLKSSKKAWMIK